MTLSASWCNQYGGHEGGLMNWAGRIVFHFRFDRS
jgi:hypothetical protein